MSNDPFFAREQKKYRNPVSSREYLLSLFAQKPKMTLRTIAQTVRISDPQQIEGLARRIQAMVKDGQLIVQGKIYKLPSKHDCVNAVVKISKDGYVVCVRDDNNETIALCKKHSRWVFDGDHILVHQQVNVYSGQPEAIVIQVLRQSQTSLVGTLYKKYKKVYVMPLNKRLPHLCIAKPVTDFREDSLVLVDRLPWQSSREPTGKVRQYIPSSGQEIQVALINYNIRWQWPQQVLTQCEQLSQTTSYSHRFDLRELPFATIDGKDSQDFDDAVYCTQENTGFSLYIAIADVSHYVQPGSTLDKEAQLRGNSVYFSGRVIPMLPEKLANNLCSLNPHEDKLALICQIQLDKSGNIISYQFYEAVFRSHARLTYQAVSHALESTQNDWQVQLANSINSLHKLYKKLILKRRKRGGLLIEVPEIHFTIQDDEVSDITSAERTVAHKMIEEAMLTANICAAQLLTEQRIPALYRVHKQPDDKKLRKFREYLKYIGLSLEGGDSPQVRHFAALIDKFAGREDAEILSFMVLRTMARAEYTAEGNQHFGLAYPIYTHFTSPIRRYPDLLVHRAIRALIHSRIASPAIRRKKTTQVWQRTQCYPYTTNELSTIGNHCTQTEMRADEATRYVQQQLRCRYLQPRIGEVFQGIVRSVTSFGLFVEMIGTHCEGMIHVSSLQGDMYSFSESSMQLCGKRNGICYEPGSKLKVQLARVDIEEALIDLVPVGNSTRKRKTKRP